MSLVLPSHVSRAYNPRLILGNLLAFRTILQGKTSHKYIDMNENPIMHIYYTNRLVLGFMCLFNELFYATLYLLYFTPGPICEYFFLLSFKFSFNDCNFLFCSSRCFTFETLCNGFRADCYSKDHHFDHSRYRRFSKYYNARPKRTWRIEKTRREQKSWINFSTMSKRSLSLKINSNPKNIFMCRCTHLVVINNICVWMWVQRAIKLQKHNEIVKEERIVRKMQENSLKFFLFLPVPETSR